MRVGVVDVVDVEDGVDGVDEVDVNCAEKLCGVLKDAVEESHAPGAVAYVGSREHTYFHEAFGARQLAPVVRAAEKDTIYDLASLTKVLATTTAILLLRDDGVLDLDQPVSEYLPIPAFRKFTLRHCLTHSAGLVAGLPYYKSCVSVNEMLQRYAARELEYAPATRHVYSDVGFMILGKVAELVARDSLDSFCAKRIFEALGMTQTRFNPPESWADRCAATEDCQWRGKIVLGSVHDENAYAVGGVAGHAGLFAPAEDIARFCRAMLNHTLLCESTIEEMIRPGQLPSYPWQGLGWKVDPWACGSEGYQPSRRAIGHTGWTGTSLWMDFDSGMFVILLGNTCHPSRDARDSRTLRRVFHTAVAREFFPAQANTHTGLDRLVWEGFDRVRGKRLAVLTNHSAVDQLGRPILEVLALEPSAEVRIVYTPEHGLRGQAEAGETVASGKEGALLIVSLYGGQRVPSREELAQIDLFIVDLQDVGSRYYTYMATMRDCLKACAAARTPVLVLDRPNPVGGEVLEGPIATETSTDVCCAPLPVRHGMTLGESALFFQKTLLGKNNLRVEVCTMDNWPRHLLFSQCALPWIPPSPNMPTPATALLYVGMCLFEGTNLNEGRGTDIPFEVVGAPWLDAQAVIERIAPGGGRNPAVEEHTGCTLHAHSYTPIAIPGKASDPRYRDQPCSGIRISVEEPNSVRAFTLALALIIAIRKQHPDRFTWEDRFDVLAGTPDLRRQIEGGDAALDIVERYAPSLAAFDKKRPRLYE